MRLRHIEVFHAIYTTGSITNAANLLCVSQPSVSKVLSHAELQLGFQLFLRSKGKLIPTTEANILFNEVDKIYKQLGSIKRLSDNIKRSEQGIIDVAVTPALGFNVLPKAIALFKAAHTNAQVRIQTLHNEDAASALLEHKCDLAILFEPSQTPQISEIDLGSSEIVLVHRKSENNNLVSPESLLSDELIGIWDSGPLGQLALDRISELGYTSGTSLQVDTYYVAAKMVAEGLGNCAIDFFTANANMSPITAFTSFSPTLNFTIKALHLESRPLPRICNEFLKVVSNVINNEQHGHQTL